MILRPMSARGVLHSVQNTSRCVSLSHQRLFLTARRKVSFSAPASLNPRVSALLSNGFTAGSQLAKSRQSGSRCLTSDASYGHQPPRLPKSPSSNPIHRDVPSYDLTFTCKPCKTRSTHRISKQGYHKGTVLITCPHCENRHLISDNLKIFSDRNMTIDKFLEEQGEVVKRGALGPNGDIEIWNQDTDDPSQGTHVGEPSQNLPLRSARTE